MMGGDFSHEFHLISKYGEDDIFVCGHCQTAYNKEVISQSEQANNGKRETVVTKEKQVTTEEITTEKARTEKAINEADRSRRCPECQLKMEHKQSIEIGHTFYLGTKYSEQMNARLPDRTALEMCCFGIGVTRILSAFIAQSESLEIDWPLRIAPYHVLVIPPKRGSKENVDEIGSRMAENIANALQSKGFDVLLDDRAELTIGRRRIDSLAYGFPYRVIVGRESMNEVPKFELHRSTEAVSLTHAELLGRFEEIKRNLL